MLNAITSKTEAGIELVIIRVEMRRNTEGISNRVVEDREKGAKNRTLWDPKPKGNRVGGHATNTERLLAPREIRLEPI